MLTQCTWRGWRVASFVVGLLSGVGSVRADERAVDAPSRSAESAPSTASLAKTSQNPIADLVSLPLQFNFNSGGAMTDRSRLTVNFQPVIPIRLSPRVNVIARTVLPISRGLGDTQQQLFLTPSRPGRLIWGIGPALYFPTATVRSLRTGSWGAGPDVVLVAMPGPLVLGFLASQIWTLKDNGGSPKVNLLTVQPFINYNFGDGWALTFAPLMTANWEATNDQTWTVPVGGGISRTFVFGTQPMTLGAHYYRNVVRPDDSAANQLRMVMSLLFPTEEKKP